MYLTAQEVLRGGKESGRSSKSSYQLHTAHEPRQDPLPRHIHACNVPELLSARTAAFTQRLRAPVFSHIADGTTAALMVCVSVQSSCTEKCKGEYARILKYTSPVRRPRTEEAILLYKQACSKPAAGSGWQMDIFFLSPFLPPKQQQRCCQAASVSAYSPRQVAQRWMKSSMLKQLIETWLLSEIPPQLLLKNMLHSRVHIL